MKRKVQSYVFFVVLLLLTVFLVHKNSLAAENETGVVTAAVLNVRTGAGTNYEILKQNETNVTLAKGNKVTILEKKTGWYKVSFTYKEATLTGYVSSSYIALETTATQTPAPTPTATPVPLPKVTYRMETTYKEIKVSAKTNASAKLYKKDGKTRYRISKKYITLSKNKKVTIVGEKLISKKKWFKITFKYKKKQRTAYVQNKLVKMTLKKPANAAVFQVKKSVKIRTKKGTASPYKKVNKKIVRITKGSVVSIVKDVSVNKTRWYKISYVYEGKTRTGYVNSKYIKLAKKAVTKKVPVVALNDAQFEQMMKTQGFPESYKQSLRVLHKAHPYWQFQAYKTGIDWNTAVTNESKTGVNLISNAKSEAWKSKEPDAYDEKNKKWKVFDGSTWVAASKEAVAYYMDPRNFLNERSVFMFELLEYQSQYQTKDGVNTIISNTPFFKKAFTYKNLVNGAEQTMYYVDAFMEAAKNAKISPYHLASRVKQEVVTSTKTTSSAVSGTVKEYPGIYNFYNIGATSSKNPVLNGLKWASDTKAGTYLRPWTDPYRSILGGAQYISQGYISKGQNTGYLEKFNVTSYQTYKHQYMTNVEAAYAEAIKTWNAYSGMVDQAPLLFSVPIFENMPENACLMPR